MYQILTLFVILNADHFVKSFDNPQNQGQYNFSQAEPGAMNYQPQNLGNSGYFPSNQYPSQTPMNIPQPTVQQTQQQGQPLQQTFDPSVQTGQQPQQQGQPSLQTLYPSIQTGQQTQQQGQPSQQTFYPSVQTGQQTQQQGQPSLQQMHLFNQTGSPGLQQSMNSTTSKIETNVDQPRNVLNRATVVPVANFNASNDAAILRKAMTGYGTDEAAIIGVLCRRTNAERMEIVKAFKTNFNRDLKSKIEADCSGNFYSVLNALLKPTHEFYAKELHSAMQGSANNEGVLIEVLSSLSNKDKVKIESEYKKKYGKTLKEALVRETAGYFKTIMVALSIGNRDESLVANPVTATADAKDLQAALTIINEAKLVEILCFRSYAQIKLIAEQYEKLTKKTLEKDIKDVIKGDAEDALVGIVRFSSNGPEFFARKLRKSMAGPGTKDRDLIRLVVTRCEIDMLDIKVAYQKLYGESLRTAIKEDTSDEYKHALYALIGENEPIHKL